MNTYKLATTRALAICSALVLALSACDAPNAVLTSDEATGTMRPRALVVNGPNLIANPGFESGATGAPTGWSKLFWGSQTPTFTYPVAGNGSSRAAQVSFKSTTTGDARWQHTPVDVTPGATYTYSEWYKGTASTQLDIEYTDANGALTYVWLASVTSSTSWKQLTASFVIPSGVSKISVFHLITLKGTLTLDDVALTTPVTAPLPPTVSLSASPTSIGIGQQSTLSWSASNATSCTASGAWSGAQAVSGTATMTPAGTSTYALTCTGAGGTSSASTTVTVSTTPPPTAFTEGMVSLTFDDSWLTEYTNGLPIIQASGLKVTFYLCSTPLLETWTGFMTNAMVVDIASKGHEIAGHTMTHPDLTTLTAADVATQLRDSKTYLQNLTGQQVTSFAYPYGAYNAAVKGAVPAAGYTSGRTVEEDAQNTPLTDKNALKSSTFLQSQTIAQIKAQIDQARASKTWFILTIHEINATGDIYTNSPARLQEVVNYVKQSGIKVVTVKEGRALMAN